ncbi:expansin EXLX1 family cellulose-binding protein [Polyangium sp. 6x1]|uniref:expansin EXLX1 family cellulose-binding protein n=1 Tax=Polyangium sp. 6x1 TaxID=3042689 RepID=UPI0024825DA9|nr:expansin EXLX1 family cellulose-binding protein [Polyangium sp. 6x1]MDI1449495.1 expansin EXLX1 family cellulose-binding protein [Polyangium sp. 6x1]
MAYRSLGTLGFSYGVGLAAALALVVGCGGGGGRGGGDGGSGGSGGSGSGASGSGGSGNGSGEGGAGAGSTGSGFGACDNAPTFEGDGTYYAANGSGACSFDASSDAPLLVGAMNAEDYANSGVCGACAQVKGPNGEVTVRIVDLCPECVHGDIDLSPDAFAKLAPLEDGRIPISWQFVPCDGQGPIVYHFKEGSNQWWTAVQIRNHRNAIAKLEWKSDDGAWHEVQRLDYNYFVEDKGMGPGPYTIRVTDVYGSVLEDSGIPFVEAGDAPGQGQFPACGM